MRIYRFRITAALLAALLLLTGCVLAEAQPDGEDTETAVQYPAQPSFDSEPVLPKPPPPPPDPELTLAFVGDILLGAGLEGTIAARGVDYPWVHVAPTLKRADLALANLETAVSTRGRPDPNKQFTFRSRPQTLQGAARAGLDVLTLANNHALDYGPEALLDTIDHVGSAGMHPVGAGRNAEEAFRPLVLNIQGLKVGVLGFTRVIPVPQWAAAPGRAGLASGYDPEPVLEAIDALRPQVDILVVLFHWGQEVTDQPRPTDIDLAQRMIGAGATIVVGHHPHVLQGIERHDGTLIAYSLGNFVFTSVRRRLNQETGILEVTVRRSGVTGARFTPFYIVQGQPRPVDGEEAQRILSRLDRLSQRWGTAVRPDGAIVGP